MSNAALSYRVVYPAGNLDTVITGYTPQQIKEQLVTHYRELANASVNVNGTTVTFTLPSGQKNK